MKYRTRLPEEMKSALQKAIPEKVALLEKSIEALDSMNLAVYSTDSPDLRVRHPLNNIVFITLWFGSRKGPWFEIRADSCPKGWLGETGVSPEKLKQYDAGKRPRWAVYPVAGEQDIEAAISLSRRIMKINPSWG